MVEEEASRGKIEFYPADLLEAVEVMNDLFSEGVGWLDGEEGVLGRETAERVQGHVDRLVEIVSREVILYGIAVASRQQGLMRAVLRDPALMVHLPGFSRVLELGEGRLWETELFVDAGVSWNPYEESDDPLSTEEAADVFDLFLHCERLILADVGFNQNSVALILSRLERQSDQIIEAIRRQRGVNSWKFQRSLSTLKAAAVRAANPKRGFTLYSSRDVALIKDKSFSVATIVGDVIPLLLSKDVGVAALISTIAGAAAMARPDHFHSCLTALSA